jgi:hypothetical protein
MFTEKSIACRLVGASNILTLFNCGKDCAHFCAHHQTLPSDTEYRTHATKRP